MKVRNLLLALTFFFGSNASSTFVTLVVAASTFDWSTSGHSFVSSMFPSFDDSSYVLMKAWIAFSFRLSCPNFVFRFFNAGSQCFSILAYFFSLTSNSAWMMFRVFYSYCGAVRNVSGTDLTWAASAWTANSATLSYFCEVPSIKACDVWTMGLASAHAMTPYWATRAKNYLSAPVLQTIVKRLVSITAVQLSFIFSPSWQCSLFSLNISKKSCIEFLELFDLRLTICCLMKVENWSMFYSRIWKWNLFRMRKFWIASYYGLHSSSVAVFDISSVFCMKLSISICSSTTVSFNSSNVVKSTV